MFWVSPVLRRNISGKTLVVLFLVSDYNFNCVDGIPFVLNKFFPQQKKFTFAIVVEERAKILEFLSGSSGQVLVVRTW